MKIGVIFFGLPRCTAKTLPAIQQFILNPLAEHDLFIESVFSLQTQISSVHSKEQSALARSNYDFFEQFQHEFALPEYLLENSLYQTILALGDKWKDNGQSLKHLMMQLNCIQRAYLRCKQHDCDFYIFVRPDLLIHDVIPINLFLKQYLHQKAILLTSWQWYRGMNDRFAIATKSAADHYGLRYQEILNYCERSKKPLHSETFLYDQLTSHAIRIKTCNSRMSRIRANGVIEVETFSAVKRMGGFKKAIYAHHRQLLFRDKISGFTNIFIYYFAKFFNIKVNA